MLFTLLNQRTKNTKKQQCVSSGRSSTENADCVGNDRVDVDLGWDGDDRCLSYQGICFVLVEVLTFLPTYSRFVNCLLCCDSNLLVCIIAECSKHCENWLYLLHVVVCVF